MKALFKALSIVSYEELGAALSEFRAVEQGIKNEKRAIALTKLNELNPITDGIMIKEIMFTLQNDLETSNTVEKVLLEFINRLK